MAVFGPDFNLGFDPGAHQSFTVPAGHKARVSIWGDGVIEQGLVLYRSDNVALAIMRTSPGVDDQFGGELRSGVRLLDPGDYIIGGYCKFNNQWRSSRAKVWETTPTKLIVGFDDSGNTGTNIPGFFKPDGDFNDAMISFEYTPI